jgi:hypothetical protein
MNKSVEEIIEVLRRCLTEDVAFVHISKKDAIELVQYFDDIDNAKQNLL